MKRAERVAALLFVGFGVGVVLEARKMVYYTPYGPGPGFFPLALGCILIVLGLILFGRLVITKTGNASIGRIWRDEEDETTATMWPGTAGAIRVGTVLGALMYVSLVMVWIGFQLAILSMLLVLLYTLGRQRFLTTVLVSIAGSFGVYYIFVHLLAVELPKAKIPWLTRLGI